MNWIMANIGTIVVCLFLVVMVVAAVIFMIKNKRKNGCGCGCSGCAMSSICHKETET